MANVNLLWDKSFTYYNQWDNPYFPANQANYGYYSDIPSSNQSVADTSSLYNNYDSLAYDRRNDFVQEQSHLAPSYQNSLEEPPTYNEFVHGIKSRQCFNRMSSNESCYSAHPDQECGLCPPKSGYGRSLSDYGGPTFKMDPDRERLMPTRPSSSLNTPLGSYESVTPPPDFYRGGPVGHHYAEYQHPSPQYLAPSSAFPQFDDQRSLWSQMETLGTTPQPSPQASEDEMLDQILNDLEDMEFGNRR